MSRDFNKDLKRCLLDPVFMARFIEAQIESVKELLKAGVIRRLTTGSMRSKTKWIDWRIK